MFTQPERPCAAPTNEHLDEPGLSLMHCPECGSVASVEWRATVARTVHLKVRCIHRHWFLLPADMVRAYVD
jgi:hypothetical protein